MRFSAIIASTFFVVLAAANPVDMTPRSELLSPRTVLAMRQAGCNCDENSCEGPACCANGSCFMAKPM
ncbi:hypothetical protein K458DRAFT_389271 [Lentithecium fluviatile CBS 122367]|uniref:Uncharacterized protein n=1 Tax=Lentithecium fluviatile CBS 122367 TaxID=1168545 RepID=A0A6G1J191_9PLEO|nr:hypothetical protein K458DRAFT_389271 [Lentithecium fluviatile CBS 122367]